MVGGWYCFRNSWWVFPKRKVIYLPLPIRCWRLTEHLEKNKDIRCDLTKCVRSYCEIWSEAVLEALTPVGAEVFSYPPPVDIEKVVQGLCANSPTSRSLSLSPPKVGPSWTDRWWQSRNTHERPARWGQRACKKRRFSCQALLTFVCIYLVSSSLDSLTLRSSVLGEERQVTVFAVRASRYPTQRRRGGNTTFFFRLC